MFKGLNLLALTLLISVTSTNTNAFAQSCQTDRSKYRSLYVQSLDAELGLQDVIWGPFKNGSSLRLQYEYVPSGKGTSYIRDSNPKCVLIDRTDAIKAAVMIDAMYECQGLNSCERMTEYASRVLKADPRSLPFIEDGDATATTNMKNWCLDNNIGAAQNFISGFQGTIINMQTHELAHALFHNEIEPSQVIEAEADGFAAYVAEIAEVEANGIRPSSTTLLLSQFVQAERNYELVGKTHPPSECRIEASLLGLKGWYEKHRQFNAPASFSSSSIEPSLAKAMANFLPKNDKLCESYINSFHRGVELGHQTISKQTDIKFLFEGYGERCEVNGGSKR